jgi:hypothetical protein
VPSISEFVYDKAPAISEAIKRFDLRNNEVSFFPTLIGIITPDSKEGRVFQLFSVGYNVSDVDLTDLFASLDLNINSQDNRRIFNFVPEFLALDKFIEVHRYIEGSFRLATGTSLSEFVYILWAISSLALIPSESLGQQSDYGLHLLELLRRGYSVYRGNVSKFAEHIIARLKEYPGLDSAQLAALAATLPSALARLTLSSEQQKKISPWSGGPRAIVIPFGEFVLIDLVGILGFVMRMFTGIRDDGTLRGTVFESTVRNSIITLFEPKGFTLGPRKLYNDGVLVDEVDLMLRKDRRVFVCECFSMWMPL